MEPAAVSLTWLSGIRVFVLGHYVPAPLAAYCLRAMGATVIKVEDGQGDHLRHMGRFEPPIPGNGPMFQALNGGFQSLGLQYRSAAGAAILRRLLSSADVLLDGNRAGALARYLGAAPQEVAPHIIYVPISAYGLQGPLSHLAGHDNNVLALGGNLSYTQRDAQGLPTVFSAPVADIMAGQFAAMAALGALVGQGRSSASQGHTLDASMLHAGFFLNLLELAARNDAQQQPLVPGEAWMNGGRPDYRSYRCADGKFIFYGLLEPWAAARFYKAIGHAELCALMQDAPALLAALQALFASEPQAHWVEMGAQHDACITAVNSLEEAVIHPQVQALGRMQQLALPGGAEADLPSFPLGVGAGSAPVALPGAAPALGQHNDAILEAAGWSAAEIAALYADGTLIKG